MKTPAWDEKKRLAAISVAKKLEEKRKAQAEAQTKEEMEAVAKVLKKAA